MNEEVKVNQEQPVELKMSAYELNQQIISQLNELTQEEIVEKIDLINKFWQKTGNIYGMLLCRDINYYTLFRTNTCLTTETIGEAAIECISILGKIKSIEITEDESAIELWFTNKIDNTFAAYLFPYDLGVIECL